ncbi:hypothetical protein [Thioalkalivibrio sp. ALE16]|uniref:hypothetical protein n=1 Tax=Thioalkalivibrio sp. ALE16 TaxID=1158172 RepID=UPI00037B65D7|nr:hypothetical protein [Thioalkalivibrio sp. ALE16]
MIPTESPRNRIFNGLLMVSLVILALLMLGLPGVLVAEALMGVAPRLFEIYLNWVLTPGVIAIGVTVFAGNIALHLESSVSSETDISLSPGEQSTQPGASPSNSRGVHGRAKNLS